jgi:hypothetical protein
MNINMKYKCEICEYSTNIRCNYNKHLLSKQHNKMITFIVEEKNTLKKESLCCLLCGMTYKHSSSYYKHKKKCGNNELTLQEEKMNLIMKENERVNGMLEYLTNRLEKITDVAINKPSTSVNLISNTLNYVSKNYINADILKKLDNYKHFLNKDSRICDETFSEEYEDENSILIESDINIIDINRNKILVEDIALFYKYKSLHSMIGDFLIENYSKKDKSKQALHVTDSSRMKYIYATLENEMKSVKWKTDPKGVNIGKIIIDPILDHIKKHIKFYRNNLAHKFEHAPHNVSDYEHDMMESCAILLAVLSNENKRERYYDLKQRIIEYITPYFEFDKTLLLDEK